MKNSKMRFLILMLAGLLVFASLPQAAMANNINTTSIVSWGSNDCGQRDVPTGLTDVKAIAAGEGHNVVLKADGTVVAWGDNFVGQLEVPAGLTNVTAIAAGGFYNFAFVNNVSYTVTFDAGGGTPVPDSQTVVAGGMAIEPATVPTKAGFVFAGWYQGVEVTTFDFATPINSEVTLNAGWLAPTDLITDTSGYITDNIANGSISNVGNGLNAKLENITAKLNSGNTKTALNQLDAFINAVAAQKGKGIEPATADQLIQAAQLIIASINQV